jgi:hypothetical protein
MEDEVEGALTGVVRAPNGKVPISGALLYLTKTRPEAQPDTVYCDTCVTLDPGTPFALTGADGSFSLDARALGTQYLVIQKGGFRRIREIYVNNAGEKLPDTLTTLPPKTDLEAGDEVPRMTVVAGKYDEIEASLAKLGIDPTALEIVQSPLIGVAAKEFLTDKSRVMGRHILFLPCGDYTQPTPNIDLSAEPAIIENLHGFVEAGGRLYVTDWHYDFVARTFPGFIDWQGESEIACSGCDRLSYDAPAEIVDAGLSAWLDAQKIGGFSFEKNYTRIASLNPVATTDAAGNPKTVTPRVWANGKENGGAARPATVSFETGCGRVLFSTYHTEPFSTELTPQERTLLGILLEVSVCNDSSTGVVIK